MLCEKNTVQGEMRIQLDQHLLVVNDFNLTFTQLLSYIIQHGLTSGADVNRITILTF